MHAPVTWPSVDKIAQFFFSVRFLLVRQDLIEGTVDAKRLKTKNSIAIVSVFFSYEYKKQALHVNQGRQGHRICSVVGKKI